MAIDAPFGRMITAMVTPFNKDGSVDWDGVAKLAQHLVDTGHDAIAIMKLNIQLIKPSALLKLVPMDC